MHAHPQTRAHFCPKMCVRVCELCSAWVCVHKKKGIACELDGIPSRLWTIYRVANDICANFAEEYIGHILCIPFTLFIFISIIMITIIFTFFFSCHYFAPLLLNVNSPCIRAYVCGLKCEYMFRTVFVRVRMWVRYKQNIYAHMNLHYDLCMCA